MNEEAQTESEKVEPVDENKFAFADYIADLDMEEMDFVESVSGCSVDEVETPGRPKSLFLAAVGLAYARRTDNDISWTQVRKLKMPQLKELIEESAKAKKVKAPQDHKPKATSSNKK